jgi:hypothetical protein
MSEPLILNWADIVSLYGESLDIYKSNFLVSRDSTYGLLLSRFTDPVFEYQGKPSKTEVERLQKAGVPSAYEGSIHAERYLVGSAQWTDEIAGTFRNWPNRPSGLPVVVFMILSRSPCPTCSNLLCSALNDLKKINEQAVDNSRFVLACRGAYGGPRKKADAPGTAPTTPSNRELMLKTVFKSTSNHDLIRLQQAGWWLCALQAGDKLAPSGKVFLQGIKLTRGVELADQISRPKPPDVTFRK